MITLKDIAREAGVSTVSVSNVINGNYKKVSQETIEKVEKIIEKYDYQPNATARSLAKKESRIIGVVVPNINEKNNYMESPYNAVIVGVLEHIIRVRDYYLMIRSVQRGTEIIPILNNWNVDGVIFLGVFKEDAIEIQKRVKLPMIFMDTYFEELQLANIGVQDFKGGYLATKYLISRGHTRIAFAGPDTSSKGVVQERFNGFKRAMEESNLPVPQENIFTAYTLYEPGVEIGKRIAFSPNKITAVVVTSDIMALGIMEGLRLSGLTVPGDVSLIGFDNLPECRYSNPQLTSVSQNLEKKAEMAANYLFEMIQEKKRMVFDEKIDVEIIERQSVKTLQA